MLCQLGVDGFTVSLILFLFVLRDALIVHFIRNAHITTQSYRYLISRSCGNSKMEIIMQIQVKLAFTSNLRMKKSVIFVTLIVTWMLVPEGWFEYFIII